MDKLLKMFYFENPRGVKVTVNMAGHQTNRKNKSKYE